MTARLVGAFVEEQAVELERLVRLASREQGPGELPARSGGVGHPRQQVSEQRRGLLGAAPRAPERGLVADPREVLGVGPAGELEATIGADEVVAAHGEGRELGEPLGDLGVEATHGGGHGLDGAAMVPRHGLGVGSGLSQRAPWVGPLPRRAREGLVTGELHLIGVGSERLVGAHDHWGRQPGKQERGETEGAPGLVGSLPDDPSEGPEGSRWAALGHGLVGSLEPTGDHALGRLSGHLTNRAGQGRYDT